MVGRLVGKMVGRLFDRMVFILVGRLVCRSSGFLVNLATMCNHKMM